jgi:hypothetical protein
MQKTKMMKTAQLKIKCSCGHEELLGPIDSPLQFFVPLEEGAGISLGCSKCSTTILAQVYDVTAVVADPNVSDAEIIEDVEPAMDMVEATTPSDSEPPTIEFTLEDLDTCGISNIFDTLPPMTEEVDKALKEKIIENVSEEIRNEG